MKLALPTDLITELGDIHPEQTLCLFVLGLELGVKGGYHILDRYHCLTLLGQGLGDLVEFFLVEGDHLLDVGEFGGGLSHGKKSIQQNIPSLVIDCILHYQNSMGNIERAEVADLVERVSTAENEPEPQPLVENCCLKNIIYIKKHFHDCLLPLQRKKLTNLQKVITSFSYSCISLGISEEEHKVLFKSVHDQLKNLKKEVENMWKKNNSDYESLMQKMEREGKETPEFFDIIEMPRSDTGPASLIDLNNINFSILSQSNNTLCYLAGLALKNSSFVIEQGMKSSKIDKFVDLICLNYNVTSYHNFSHAFSVFLMAHQSFTLSPEVKQYINSQELFFMLIACISHDLNHQGRNNMYYIKRKAEYAKIYSNHAVLENMHISLLFRLMDENPEADILNFKDATLKPKARKLIMKNILATDMSSHFGSLKHFKEKCDAAIEPTGESNDKMRHLTLQKDKEVDREMIMEMIIHACDIGNPCYEFKNYMNWAALLTYEFNEQHKKEISKSLEPTPFLKYIDKPSFYNGQIGFCKTFVYPLWKQLSVFSPALKMFTEQVEENISILEKKIALMP